MFRSVNQVVLNIIWQFHIEAHKWINSTVNHMNNLTLRRGTIHRKYIFRQSTRYYSLCNSFFSTVTVVFPMRALMRTVYLLESNLLRVHADAERQCGLRLTIFCVHRKLLNKLNNYLHIVVSWNRRCSANPEVHLMASPSRSWAWEMLQD